MPEPITPIVELSEADLDKVVTVKVAGEPDAKKPIREVLKDHQLAAYSHKVIRESKEELKASTDKAANWELFQKGISGNDAASLRQAFRAAGVSDTQIDGILAGKKESPAPPRSRKPVDDDDDMTDREAALVQKLAEFEAKQAEVESKQQNLINSWVADKQHTTAVERAKIIDGILDNDPFFGTILSAYGPRAQEALRSKAYENVGRRVGASPRKDFNPAVVKAGLDDLRAILEEEGHKAPSGEDGDDPDQVPDGPRFGKSGLPGVGRGHYPTTGSAVIEVTKTPPRRVSINDPGFSKDFAAEVKALEKKLTKQGQR